MKNTQRHPLNRRSFLKSAGMAATAFSFWGCATEDEIAYATRNVNRNSRPSQLKITDLRIAVVKEAPFRCPIIRIDTNQGIHGLGEVRDGGRKELALSLKNLILGENPCEVETIFNKLKPLGDHGRKGGGVSGIEMALWDLAGKAYDTPVYKLLGGKCRDKIRMYCDTTSSRDPVTLAKRLKDRMDKGYTFLKMDLGVNLLYQTQDTLTREIRPVNSQRIEQPFARFEITEKGIEILANYVVQVRNVIGDEIPLGIDHFGPIGVDSCIRLGKAFEPCHIAWLEDMVPWEYGDLLKIITDALDVPILTGEDIYLVEEFAKLIDKRAVDMIHPDLATAGGILETKKIGDYAEKHGIPMAMHFAGTPISCMANVHAAAATRNFVALENHSVDVPWWDDLVTGIPKPIVQDGFITVPDSPGLGVELNEEVVKTHLHEPGYFEASS